MLEKLTIIVPTRNREKHLLRLVAYAKTLPVHVAIYDNSSTYNPNNISTAVKPFANISYNFVESESFSDKIQLAVNAVKTPYTCICADDDFLILSALEQMLGELEKDTHLGAVHGFTLGFYTAAGQVGFEKMYTQENATKALSESGLERVEEIFTPYLPSFYAVHRTSNLKKIFAFSSSPELLSFVEFSQAFGVAALGKFKVLPILYHIREAALFSSGYSSTTLLDLSTKIEHKEVFEQFKSNLIQHTFENYNISSTSEAEVMVSKALKAYIQFAVNFKPNQSVFSYAYIKQKYLKPFFPKLFSWLVKQKQAVKVKAQTLANINWDSYSNSKSAYEELIKIEQIILQNPVS